MLNTDLNTLIKQYFKGSDFGRQSLILSVTDDANVTMQKLRSQLKYLLAYSTELDVNVKKAIESLTKFKTFLDTQESKTNLKGIAIPKMPSEAAASIPFIKLMVSIRQSERLIYNIRPNIVEIVKGTNNVDSLSADAPAQQKTSMFSMGSSTNKKYNLKYFEVVIPLENTIKQIDSVIFEDTDNIFIDLIVDRNDPNNEKYKPTIELFSKKINEQYQNAFDDIVFSKFIKSRIVEQPAEIASISSTNTSSPPSSETNKTSSTTTTSNSSSTNAPVENESNVSGGLVEAPKENITDPSTNPSPNPLPNSLPNPLAEINAGITKKQSVLTSAATQQFADQQAALTKGLTTAANANVTNALTKVNDLNKISGGGKTRRKNSYNNENKKQEYNIRLV